MPQKMANLFLSTEVITTSERYQLRYLLAIDSAQESTHMPARSDYFGYLTGLVLVFHVPQFT